MNARPARIVLIVLLALASAACTAAEKDLTGVDPVTGTLSVGVTSPGSSDLVITVLLSGPEGFSPRSASMRVGGASTFTGLEPGTYTVTTTILGFDCRSVSAEVQGNRNTTANIACTRKATPATGFVIGIVSVGDSPIEAASVELAAPGVVLTRRTGPNGQLSFVGVQAGEYTLSTLHEHYTCPVQTIHVEADQTTTASISCVRKPTGAIAGIVLPSDLVSATVQLTGPTSATATATGSLNGASFEFDELPPGTYAVTATASGMSCAPVSANVQAGQTTTVEIHCVNNPPVGSEFVGNWDYYRLQLSRTGICPATLAEAGTGSITFNSSTSTLQIVGLDPQLAIVGGLDVGSGRYTGSGAAVLGDGSSIQSDVTLYFYEDTWYTGGLVFSTDATASRMWTRRHHDPTGNLVCTEVYEAYGSRAY